jgi:flagellar hook-associated protein 2
MSSTSINLISSQIDVASIVDSLMNIERAPVYNMQSQVATLQSKLSAFQSINTKLSSLSNKVNTMLFGDTDAPILKPFSFNDRLSESVFSKCKVTSSDEASISAIASNVNSTGSYAITVSNLAQARSISSSGFADATTTTVGTGTLTIATGSNDPVTLTINSTNNTLTGIRNAINNANAGITATIINDGSSSPYKLLVTANAAGTANSFTLNTDSLTGGQDLGFTQRQGAEDAVFTLNGISITKSSNTVSDVIDGVTFILKKESASSATLEVSRDIDGIVGSLQGIVTSYNDINSYINNQFAYNSTTKKAGTLSGDSTLRRIQSQLQDGLTESVSNRFSSITVAGQVGIDFNRDGSLSMNESKLREALSNDFSSVAALFLGDGTPAGSASLTDSRVTYNEKTSATQAGSYDIAITALAEQASVVGSQAFAQSNEMLTIMAGAQSVEVDISGAVAIGDALGLINNALSGANIAAIATDDGTGRIKIATNNYGSSQNISVRSDFGGSSGFSTSTTSDTGVNIAGTIGGYTAVGNGLTLTGAVNEPIEGLSLSIAQTTTGNYGTVTIASETVGVEGKSILMNMQTLLDGITDPLSGPLYSSKDAINKNIKNLNDQISNYEDRLTVKQQMLTDEYNRVDTALKQLQLAQSSISSALSSLPT